MEPSSKNFPVKELRCHCPKCNDGQPNKINPDALAKLQIIRDSLGEVMVLTSAYRCPNHPAERKKRRGGSHTRGVAFDILVPWGEKRMRIVELAMEQGFRGFGFSDEFLHIDMDSPQFRSWGY